jgi:hypothetical protein
MLLALSPHSGLVCAWVHEFDRVLTDIAADFLEMGKTQFITQRNPAITSLSHHRRILLGCRVKRRPG